MLDLETVREIDKQLGFSINAPSRQRLREIAPEAFITKTEERKLGKTVYVEEGDTVIVRKKREAGFALDRHGNKITLRQYDNGVVSPTTGEKAVFFPNAHSGISERTLRKAIKLIEQTDSNGEWEVGTVV
jgi:hypothetical protein